MESSQLAASDRFQPSPSWAGPRPGYAFKRGNMGVGYYCDPLQPAAEPQRQAGPVGAQGAVCAAPPSSSTPQQGQEQEWEQQQQQEQHSEDAGAGRHIWQQHAAAAAAAAAAGGSTHGGGSAPAAAPLAKAPAVVQKSNPFLKHLKGKKAPAAAAAGGDAKRAKKDDGAEKPAYLREMDRYREMSCSADTKHDRPLVK